MCVFLWLYLCRLEELFLCLNEYENVSLSSISYPSLRLLHITDNQLQKWVEVRKLGLIYPGLVSLILANNSLSSIHEPEDSLHRLFPNLRSINLHNSGARLHEHHLCRQKDLKGFMGIKKKKRTNTSKSKIYDKI